MIKYLSLALICATFLHAVEEVDTTPAQTQQTEASGEAIDATDASEFQTLSQSIDLIMQDLERSIELMDNPNRAAILENFVNIDQIARETLLKLMALMKMAKPERNYLAELGVETEQVQALQKLYVRFKAKLNLLQAAVMPADTIDSVPDNSQETPA